MMDTPFFVATELGSGCNRFRGSSSHQLRIVYSRPVTESATMIQTASCWHRAAWRLLRKAAEMVRPPVVEIIEAELQALVDELYA